MNRSGSLSLMYAVTLLLGVLVAGTAFAMRAHHQRDEQGFRSYVTGTSKDMVTVSGPEPRQADRGWAADHRAAMLAEGDRACAWLESQPDVPSSDTARSVEVSSMISRYLADAEVDERISQTYMAQTSLVAGAWAFLCLDTRSVKTNPNGGTNQD